MGVPAALTHDPAKMRTKSAAIGLRKRYSKRAREDMPGLRWGFRVAARALSVRRMRVGRTVKTLSIDKKTPLARAMPRSSPIPRDMKHSMRRPTTVVIEEETIEEKAPRRAFTIASVFDSSSARSCRYRFMRMIE